MKIICTKQEKADIIEALMDASWCFAPNENEDCVYDSGCGDCIENHIEWEITDGDHG